ncbi:MAG: isocitrate/isopropylmalate family dehydrogenase, partial [Serpentinimonas sp.]|nr:isocitrate/isopropylmalate family dehydrogenase [Serpentinimonas sp.]
VSKEYPQIEVEHMIIDIGAARLATRPERFDVIVTLNLYGDIISDIAAEITGSVGLAPSANMGDRIAMFEAIHGSAPDIAGKGIANPSGLLLAAVMMLIHIGQSDVAEKIHNAWLRTIEDGIITADLSGSLSVGRPFGSMDFADAVIDRLGQEPSQLKPVRYIEPDQTALAASAASNVSAHAPLPDPVSVKALVGVDVFVNARQSADFLAGQLSALVTPAFHLQMITNRGVKVWPGGFPETFCTDHWRCRFVAANGASVTHFDLIELMEALAQRGIDFIKTENLCTFDGERGYALGQGQ